uniref:Uncharacterized protein n=1 Tax=Rhizophora mucronata TaxID=61149 RepID=A0A2P2NC15_RHIMU
MYMHLYTIMYMHALLCISASLCLFFQSKISLHS